MKRYVIKIENDYVFDVKIINQYKINNGTVEVRVTDNIKTALQFKRKYLAVALAKSFKDGLKAKCHVEEITGGKYGR